MSVPAVVLAGLTKRYEGSGAVLQDISLQISARERVAIVGPSGSGKSTLLHVMGTLEKFDEGHMAIDGNDVAAMSDGELADLRAASIGFVFQQFFLLDALNVLRNVEQCLLYSHVPGDERTIIAREALAAVGLTHRLEHRPSQLSGGERQRVAIARAIASRPSLLLADEPTGNLDSRTGAEILELLCGIDLADSAIVVVTHDADVASFLQRRIVVRDGHIESDQ
jgi:putative ABC transport system ATP-binding protein